MGVWVIFKYLIAEGKEKEHDEALKKFIRYIMEHPEKYGMMKAFRHFVQLHGGRYRRRISIEEFETFSEYAKYRNTIHADEKFLEIHDLELLSTFDRKTLKITTWEESLRDSWME